MQKYSIDSTWSWTKPNAIQKICWSSNNSSIELESANDDQFKVDTISALSELFLYPPPVQLINTPTFPKGIFQAWSEHHR